MPPVGQTVIVKVLFATAELSPLARVGGLAAAAAGLVAELRRIRADIDVELQVVVPDYSAEPLLDETSVELDVPAWAGPALARTGAVPGHPELGEITLVRSSRIDRPHPYTDATGKGFADNDHRFFAFSAAVAALVEASAPDVLHLNDWHTGATLAFLAAPPPTVLTIHTLGYQGATHHAWLDVFPHHREQFFHLGACNPLAGAIRLADVVVTVSPNYAREILTHEGGLGLSGELAARGSALVGILNGIDTAVWDPANDPALLTPYSAHSAGEMLGKEHAHDALCDELGLDRGPGALAVVVTRLADQKGIDLLVPCLHALPTLPLRVAVLGDGDRSLAERLHNAAATQRGRVAFHQGYDEGLAHRLFAAADLFLMPSRFEPCGLAQMQAMRYGAIPVVTDVGGLHDTVVDIDLDPARGTGVVARRATAVDLMDALHRGVRAVGNRRRRDAMRRRGMAIDWSWNAPALLQVEHYRRIIDVRAHRR